MPTMLRTSKKARRIARDILGKPANWTEKLTPEQKELKERLLFLETSFQR